MSDTLDRLTAALTDRYRIEREVGAGGMATVYLARDIKHNRNVALKVLKPDLAAVITLATGKVSDLGVVGTAPRSATTDSTRSNVIGILNWGRP